MTSNTYEKSCAISRVRRRFPRALFQLFHLLTNNWTTGEIYIYSSLSLDLLKISKGGIHIMCSLKSVHNSAESIFCQIWRYYQQGQEIPTGQSHRDSLLGTAYPAAHSRELAQQGRKSGSILDDIEFVRTQKCTLIRKGEKEAISLE